MQLFCNSALRERRLPTPAIRPYRSRTAPGRGFGLCSVRATSQKLSEIHSRSGRKLAAFPPYRAAKYSFFVQPTTRGRPRGPRAHTRFDLSTALPETKSARGARRRDTHLAAPRKQTAQQHIATSQATQTDKPHRTRATSKPRPSVVIPPTPSPQLHQHISITAKHNRRTMPRRNVHPELWASSRKPDA